MATRAPILAADALWYACWPSAARAGRPSPALAHARHQLLRRGSRRSVHAAASAMSVPSWGQGSRGSRNVQQHVQQQPRALGASSYAADGMSVNSRPASAEPPNPGNPSADQQAITRRPQADQAPDSLPRGASNDPLVADIWAKLDEAAATADKAQVQKYVLRLVRDFGCAPDANLYRALLLAEADPLLGYAPEVERLLQQADLDGIPVDAGIYHAALRVSLSVSSLGDGSPQDLLTIIKALAVHPNYVLRTRLLAEMERRWLDLDSSGWHSVVAALLRERQLELALEQFQQMQQAGYRAAPWLLHLAIASCLSADAFPEALALLQQRSTYDGNEPQPIPSSIWALALNSAAHAHSHPLVDHVWRRAVEASYLNPSSGTCTAVLNTAARHGNFRLASDVFRVLGARRSPLQAHHYEALLESYLVAGDLPRALTVVQLLRGMQSTNDPGAWRSLVRFLAKDTPQRVPHALALLLDPAARPQPMADDLRFSVAAKDRKKKMKRQKSSGHNDDIGNQLPPPWDAGPVLAACIEALARVGAWQAACDVYRAWDQYAGTEWFAAKNEVAAASAARETVAVESAGVGMPARTQPPDNTVYEALFKALRHVPTEEAEAAQAMVRELKEDQERLAGKNPAATRASG